MVLVEKLLFWLKYSKYKKLYPFIFSQKYQNNAKYAKKNIQNSSGDSLGCGPILDNLEINP